jgi:hypothetical protein
MGGAPAALDYFRNWLTWACGPRNAMKIVEVQNDAGAARSK